MSLLASRKNSAEEPGFTQHFNAMIGVVLQSISAAKKLISSAQYDTGEDKGLAALQIPATVGTDLAMLEFIIQSQIGN